MCPSLTDGIFCPLQWNPLRMWIEKNVVIIFVKEQCLTQKKNKDCQTNYINQHEEFFLRFLKIKLLYITDDQNKDMWL